MPLSFLFASANNVNKDVFETFFLKRTSKSSHSSKSSNDSFRGIVDDTTPTQIKPYSYGANDSKPTTNKITFPQKYQRFNGKSSSMRSEKSEPRQYLFGSSFNNKSTANKPEKENIYNDTSDLKDSDRFKTITISSLRRSFRDTFLDSSKPAKGREHQQLWFIDVNEKNESKSTEPNNSRYKTNNLTKRQSNDDGVEYDNRNRTSIKRNETFRVDNKDNEHRPSNNNHSSLGRRETFRIEPDESSIKTRERLKSPSIDSNSSNQLASDRKLRDDNSRKMVPIAVTAPYSAQNDNDINYTSGGSGTFKLNKKINKFGTYVKQRYNSNNLSSNNSNDDDKYSINQDYSALRYDKCDSYDRRPLSTNKTLIEIKSPETYSKYQYNYDDTNKEPFENRTISERQSYRDINTDTINRPRTHRSFASLRSKLERTALNNNRNNNNLNSNTYDDIDGITENDTKNDTYKSTEPWRSITSRQFSKDKDTENRSFVPYRSNYENHDHDPLTKTNNCNNRTTININYNYNLPTNKQYSPNKITNTNHNDNNDINTTNKTTTFSMPLTMNKSASAIKSNSAKEKPNKNRSVNFPSVECEVRLISPNYDKKPRRKESWKAKPANDWTFNKVHL